MGHQVVRVQTLVSESQMAQAIIEAWKDLFGNEPTKDQVAMILAHNALETGHRKSMWNFNVGNITTNGKGKFNFFVIEDLKSLGKPIHLKFRSYLNLKDGTQDYLKLLSGSHYSAAWQKIIHPDPVAFSKALKEAGYYGEGPEAPYTKAISGLYNQFSKSNSYEQAKSGKVNLPASHQTVTSPKHTTNFYNVLDHYIKMVNASVSHISNKKLYKKALPNNNILIEIESEDHTNAIEFSRILCSALDQELLSTSYIYTDGKTTEVECQISGPGKDCLATIEQFSKALTEAFYDATIKIGGVNIITKCSINKRSSCQSLSLNAAQSNYRKFLLKFI